MDLTGIVVFPYLRAAVMTGKRSGFITRVQEKNHKVVGIHCIIHREAIASKSMQGHLNCVFLTDVKIVNFIKARALNSRLFITICEEMGAEHMQLFLHTEVRWLSRGRVFTRLFELREDFKFFWKGQSQSFWNQLKTSNLFHCWLIWQIYLINLTI